MQKGQFYQVETSEKPPVPFLRRVVQSFFGFYELGFRIYGIENFLHEIKFVKPQSLLH